VPVPVLRLRSGSARFAFQYKRRGRTRRLTIGAYIADLRDRAARGVKRGRLSTAAGFERLLNRLILPTLGHAAGPPARRGASPDESAIARSSAAGRPAASFPRECQLVI
jgi:hypothetical protein